MGKKIFISLVAFGFFYISKSLLIPVAMGVVLAVLFFPWQIRLEKRGVPSALVSFLLTSAITVLLILPSSILVFFAAQSGIRQLQLWRFSSQKTSGEFFHNLLSTPNMHGLMTWVTRHIPISMYELTDTLQDFARSLGIKLTELLAEGFSHLPGLLIALLVIIVSVYFFLLDGKKLTLFLRRNSVFSAKQTDLLLKTLSGMCRSVILAALVSAIVQSMFEVVTCMVTNTPNVLMIGLLVFVSSFIPLVGSAPITLGVAVQQLIEGRTGAGIVLLVMAVILLAADNTIRPWFLRGNANLHPFLAFIAAFGGLQALGFLGVFLGPIIAALFIATVQILVENKEVT